MQPVAMRTLIAINVAFYVPWLILLSHIPATSEFVVEHLALHPALPDLLFEPWQVITYNFIHLGTDFWGGFLHILFNMLALWLFGVAMAANDLLGARPAKIAESQP